MTDFVKEELFRAGQCSAETMLSKTFKTRYQGHRAKVLFLGENQQTTELSRQLAGIPDFIGGVGQMTDVV